MGGSRPCFEGGGGGAEDEGTCFEFASPSGDISGVVGGCGGVLFEAGVVFFVEDDYTEIWQGGKYCRASPDDNLASSTQHFAPGIITFAVAEGTMIDKYLIAKSRSKSIGRNSTAAIEGGSAPRCLRLTACVAG